MKTKILTIAVIKNGNTVLMRKKPDGSKPYAETWYLFGAEVVPGQDLHQGIIEWVKSQTGTTIRIIEQLGWDTEIKEDLDGEIKHFVYLDTIAEYVLGELVPAPGIEKLEWIPTSKLKDYDIVPPAKKLFKKLGYTI